LVLNSFNFTFQKINIFIQLAVVILYPLTFHLTYKIWVFLLKFYAEIFDSKEDPTKNTYEILNAMFTSNIFLILPIAGGVFSFFAQVYILYTGIIKKLKFTKTQAFLVLLTPIFIIFILGILVVSYLVFLFSLI